jgi:hypothetical protein
MYGRPMLLHGKMLRSLKIALDSLWEEYKGFDLRLGDCGTKRARSPSPDYFDKATDMTLIQPEIQEDVMFSDGKTPVVQLNFLKWGWIWQPYRLCGRVFSQEKLLIAGYSLKPDAIEATVS